jgi:type IV secretion system protein VirB10
LALAIGLIPVVATAQAQQAPPPLPGAAQATKAAEDYSIDDLPTDDEIAQEERDTKNLMRLQMQQAQKNAATQDRIRTSEEQTAAAQAALYKQLLESRKDMAQQVNTQPVASDFGQSSPNSPAGNAVSQSLAGGQGLTALTPAQQAAQASRAGQKPGQGAESQKAIEALALEDGPEVARQKGLAFVPMGTIIDLRILTAVNTSLPGPVIGQIVYDVWDVDMKYIVIPRGSKALGMSGAMGSDTEARGRITFTTFVDPSGRNIPIAVPMIGSNRIGLTGIDGEIDYHWGKIFGGSIALAVVGSVLESQNTTSSAGGSTAALSGTDLMRQNVSQGIGNVSNQLLQRFTQIKPDISIAEGSVAKLIVTTNIMAKPYRHVWQGDGSFNGAFKPSTSKR